MTEKRTADFFHISGRGSDGTLREALTDRLEQALDVASSFALQHYGSAFQVHTFKVIKGSSKRVCVVRGKAEVLMDEEK